MNSKKLAKKSNPEKEYYKEKFIVWDLCEEICTKTEWFSKVFDEEIVTKWRSEIPTSHHHYFDFALNIVRASAQGTLFDPDCEEEDYHNNCCRSCAQVALTEARTDNPGEFLEEDALEDILYHGDLEPCDHPDCKCISPDHNLSDYIIYKPEGIISKDLHEKCKQIAMTMRYDMLKLKSGADWHPGSNKQVLDILHPSLFCYVKGISVHKNGDVNEPCSAAERYQWLPSDFSIDQGKVKLESYINNLASKYDELLIPVVEEMLSEFLPSIEKVIRKPVGKSMQVIVKIADTILSDINENDKFYKGGSWHIEGMPYERIVCTCIQYLSVKNITDSFLEFRKPVVFWEEDLEYPQCGTRYTKHHYGIDDHYDGTMNKYLGLIKCQEQGSVVFPNTLQHRVKEFSLVKTEHASSRLMISFFVIDPDVRIISTLDIDKQQSVISLSDAKKYREELMYHRKYFVDTLNKEVYEREFSLCEH